MQPVLSVAVVFLLMQRALGVLLPPSPKCWKGMRRMDRAFREIRAEDALDTAREGTAIGRKLLRARCGICRSKCKRPLL